MEERGEDRSTSGDVDQAQDETVYYGVCIPAHLLEDVQSPVQTVFTDKIEALKVLKQFKGSRFKCFNSEIEAVEFSTSSLPTQETQVSTPVPGESSTFSSLKPQQLVKFRKAIEAGNIDFVVECINENPRYLMTPSDTPAVLQEGSRYNALHIAAKSGKHHIMSIILDIIKGDLTHAMYPEADPQQNEVRQQRLIDLYLNMPDKGGGDTPLHLASKFGHLEVVELLTAESSLETTTLNKFGESPLDVVCSRAKVKSKETEDKIREAIQGLRYIPVYRELDGPSHLGEPIPVSECSQSQLRRSTASEDITDGRSTPSRGRSMTKVPVTASPSTPRLGSLNKTFTLSSSPGSPFSTISQGNISSPGYIQSPSQVARSPVFISALIGPLSEKKARSAYKELRSSSSRERLQNPVKGLERQCEGLAKRIQADFAEYWEFLDEFLDLSSKEGLERLENHLVELQQQVVRQQEAERCRELEDSDPANNSVFLGEMEFVTGNNHHQIDKNLANENDQPLIKTQETPLSPISLLSTAMNHLDFDTNNSLSSIVMDETNKMAARGVVSSSSSEDNSVTGSSGGARCRKPSVEAREMVEQFGFVFSQSLTDSLPSVDSDANIQDWGLSLVNHWDVLRRQVNIMRSDPQARWTKVDYSALACRVVECVYRELEDSVLGAEVTRVQAYLDRIASFKLTSMSEGEKREPENIAEFRIQRQNSSRDINKLREIQQFARILVFYMENKRFPERDNLESLWDLLSTSNISTQRVNKARRYLHSKVFSDSESASSASSLPEDDFSWINESITKPSVSSSTVQTSEDYQDEIDTFHGHRKRADSISSESSQTSSQYDTPPSSIPASPTPSQASSMMTADEGVVVWMEGRSPTQTDRQVFTALQQVPQDLLQSYPNLSSYMIIAGNYSMSEMRRWPIKLKNDNSLRSEIEPRKLDLDFSALQI